MLRRSLTLAALILVASCSAVDEFDERGTTALMRSAQRGDTAGVLRLLAAGADVNARVPRRDVKELINTVVKVEELPKSDFGFTPLIYAAKHGRARVVQILIDAGADVNRPARYGQTALAFAVDRSDITVVRHLMTAGASADTRQIAKAVAESPAEMVRLITRSAKDANGMAPADPMHGRPHSIWLLHAATLRGDPDVVRALLKAGADVNARDPNGWTALRWARDAEVQRTNARSKEVADLLLAAGASDRSGGKAETLFDAIHRKDAAGVAEALRSGADPNARDKRGVTAVIEAARLGEADIVRQLAAAGAHVNLNAGFGPNALTAAIERESVETVRVLLASGAKPDQRDGRGWSPLFIVGRQRRSDIAALLLAASAKVDAYDLRTAAQFGDTTIVRMLLGHGADANIGAALNGAVHACRSGDNTAMFALLLQGGADPSKAVYIMPRAADRCSPEALRLLIRHGGDPNQRDYFNITPLMYAARAGNFDKVRVLLAAGADVHARDAEGRSAVNFARRYPAIRDTLGLLTEQSGRRRR
ncbi:MAG: ankyrin repeat domain-containing protein [Gemmatimonadaceae bacterium]